MNSILGLWRRFKERPDQWFFYAFLISFPFSIRKILYFIPIEGSFNEFTSASIYLSDIFLLLTIVSWIFILYYNNIYLSSISITSRKLFHVEQLLRNPLSKTLALLILLSLSSFISIIYSEDKLLAFYKSIKITEISLLAVYIKSNISKLFHVKQLEQPVNNNPIYSNSIIKWLNLKLFFIFKIIPRILSYKKTPPSDQENSSNVPRGTNYQNLEAGGRRTFINNKETSYNFLINTLAILTISGFVHALFGIIQFIKQASIGIFWLKESIISSEMTGVAKIILNGDVFIRSYGFFPHPNIFGGFLVLTIISTLLFYKIVPRGTIKDTYPELKMFHACSVKCSTPAPSNVPRGTFLLEWNNWIKKLKAKIELPKSIYSIFWPYKSLFLIFQIMALTLTFSKSAIFGLIIAFLYIRYADKETCSTRAPSNVPRGTFLLGWKNSNLITKKSVLLLLILLNIFFIIAKPNYHSLVFRSVEDRLNFISIFAKNISDKAFFGLGSGQYILEISKDLSIENWKIEPIHNVFMLMLGELGIIPTILFIMILIKIFRKKEIVPRLPRQMFHACPIKCSTWNIFTGVEHFYCGGTIIHEKIILYSKGLLLSFIFIMLFDHYPWTIQQGQFILGIIMGLLI